MAESTYPRNQAQELAELFNGKLVEVYLTGSEEYAAVKGTVAGSTSGLLCLQYRRGQYCTFYHVNPQQITYITTEATHVD